MKELFKKTILFELFFIFLLSLTPLLWFKGNSLIVGHDNVFALNPTEFLKGRLSTWIDHGFGQSQDLIMGTIPIHLIDAIPYMLGFSLQVTEKIVYVFWFFCMGISLYILALQFPKQSRYFRFLAVILYLFNFFLLQGWWIGERTKFSAYVALPLILTVFIRVYRGEMRLLYGAVLNSIIFFIFNAGGLYGISLYGGLFVVIGTFVLFFSIVDFFNNGFVIAKKLILLALFTAIGYLLVNSYFLFPVLNKLTSEYTSGVSKVGGVEGLIQWADVISANTSFINLFRLQGIAEWYDNPQHPYAHLYLKNPFFIILSFIFPLLIFSSLFIGGNREKRKMVLFFYLVFLIGMFFSAGTHPPSGFLFEAFMQKIPGFAAAFRSPYYKFAPSLFLAISFLIAFFIDRFGGRTKKLLFVAIMVFVLGYHFPYFTVDIFSWKVGFSTRVEMPPYVYEFGKWLNKEKKDQERVLFLPPNSPYLGYSMYDWGYLSFQSLSTLVSNKAVIINNDRVTDNERVMLEALYEALTRGDNRSINVLTAHLGIGYFLLQEDTIADTLRSSFSLTAKPYREIIEEKLQLHMINKFGKWTLYKVDTPILPYLPTFYTKDKMTVVSGKIKDFSAYYELMDGLQAFLEKEDMKSLGIDISSDIDIYSPSCLKCKRKNKPFISYPKRNIFPDSPFYPLVLYKEERNLHVDNSKSLIYDYLGFILKRFSEIKEMIEIEKDTKFIDIVLGNYEAILRQIHTNLNKMSKNEDKFEVSEDLYYYIDDQRTVIKNMLGDRVRGGAPAVILTRILKSLGKLNLALQPYLFNLDITQNRLYHLTIDSPETLTINIRSREFRKVLKDKAKIKIQIDGRDQREQTVDANTFKSEWNSFGDVLLQEGDHTILLSFSDVINVIDKLFPDVTEFNSGQIQCYTTRIRDFDPRKRYTTVVRYRNDSINDVNMYTWEEKDIGKSIRFADRLRLRESHSEEEFTEDIESPLDVKGIIIGICGSGLTQEYLQDRFNVSVHEFIEPIILFVTKDLQASATREVTYQKLSATKYTVSFTTINPHSMFVFPTRFDNGWELESFEKKHIPINGFANGWIIDEPGTYSLSLSYKPQKVFQLGVALSLASVSAGMLYIFIITFKKKRGKTNEE